MIKLRRRGRRWPQFSPRYSTNQNAKPAPVISPGVSVSGGNKPQLGTCYARTTVNPPKTMVRPPVGSSGSCPAWSMSSLMALLPDSPSPICSSTSSPASHNSLSPSSDIYYSQVSTEFLTPRNRTSNAAKLSTSTVDLDDWMKTANDFGFHQPGLRKNEGTKQERSPMRMSMSSMYSSLTLPSVYEEKSQFESTDRRYDNSDLESPINGRYRFMTRPKPYPEFLDEIKKRKFEDQINSWKKAKQMKFMNKLRAKEAAVSDWEMKQTRIAMNEMKKIESKLDRKRAMALEKMQRKINRAQKMAEKKKATERKSTIKKISTINKISEKIQSAKSLIWLKIMRLC